MEREMEQLLGMGFSQELATQALLATGGNSTIKATEWILNHKPNNPTQNPNPTPSQSSPPVQPKLNRFFQSKSRSPQPQIESKTPPPSSQSQLFPAPKRPKLAHTPHEPLSERMRPRNIDGVIGQDHILSKTSILGSSVGCNRLPSIILWGPPGTGKTSIAKAIVNSTTTVTYKFISLSAVTAGVKDVRDAVEEANRMKKKLNKQTVLFVDEVHRFNKAQQDSFLPVIEDGSIVFVGATTENPSFHLITPLLSRCRVLKLNSLQPDMIVKLLRRAVDDEEKGLGRSVGGGVSVEEDVLEFLSLNCDGDARVALNALEIAATTAAVRKQGDVSSRGKSILESSQVTTTEDIMPGNGENLDNEANEESGSHPFVTVVMLDDAKEALQCKHLAYDRDGEEHYNLISALHKSMRGSDANASIYWLARMLEGGEQPLYIARRLIRFASEDVGLADPNAVSQAVACYQACHFIGMPECSVNLAQCVAYLALAPKSIAVYQAIGEAQKVVKESGGQNEGVPLHLRNAPTRLMKDFGYGKGYIYPPNDPSSASSQTYLPPSLQGPFVLNAIMGIQKPAWLEALYNQRFFIGCSMHEHAKKNEKNICCLDCCTSICPHCVPLHRVHRLLQVRRYVYNDVVRLEDLEKLIDCSRVQAYTINNAKVVFIKKRPQNRQFKGSGNYCTSCDRILQEPYIHCSLGCKVEFVLEHKKDLSLYLRRCKSLQLSPDFLLPPDIGYDEMTMEMPHSTTFADYDETMTSASSSESSGSKNMGFVCTEFVKKKRSGLYVCARSASKASSSSEEDMVTSLNRRKRIPHRSPLC